DFLGREVPLSPLKSHSHTHLACSRLEAAGTVAGRLARHPTTYHICKPSPFTPSLPKQRTQR
ncbi:hypothetical protein C8R44DRAFT_791762, partial [Mycena epipterygia]